MNKWLAGSILVAAVAYFGFVRETEARFFRRRAACCPPPVVCCPCPPPVVYRDTPAIADAPPPVAVPVIPLENPPLPAVPYAPPLPSVPAIETPKIETPKPTTPSVVTGNGKVFLVLLVDDKSKDGDADRAGAVQVERLIRDGLPKDRFAQVVTLTGGEITQERVRDKLAALPIKPDDTIVCYYAGPMAFDEATQAYTLTPDGVKLPRTKLRAELQLHKPNLIVLLTDAPSNGVQLESMKPLPFPAKVASLEGLLLGKKGLIDLNATTGGKVAFARGREGGLFTLAFVQTLAAGPASWTKAVAETASATNSLLKMYDKDVRGSDAAPDDVKGLLRRQRTQTVTPLSPLDPAAEAPESPDEPARAEALQVANTPPQPGEIVVKLPANAKLWIDSAPTRQTSAERRFETPPIREGAPFVYLLRAEFLRDGQPAVREERIEIRRGESKTIVLE